MSHLQAIPTQVSSVFEQHSEQHRAALLKVRALIFETAHSVPDVGDIEEALRWGEPAYITTRRKTGSTIRLGVEKTSGQPALFFNCKTTLVEEFRAQFGAELRYSKNRAVLIDQDDAVFQDALKICIAAALTYHLRKTA